jgi:hypothetical protein
LKAATLLITYFDRQGQPLFSISFVGSLEQSEPNLPRHMRPFINTVWKNPIHPGGLFSLKGSNLMDSSVRPASSRVSRIELGFAGENGSDLGILQGSEGQTDPLLLKLPDHLDFDLKNVPRREEALVELSIDAQGRVLEVVPRDKEAFSTQATNDLQRELTKWTFFPATKRGYAVQTNLALWMKFHSKRLPPPFPECPQIFPDSFPRTFVRVDVQYDAANHWSVSYGGYPAHGEFETIESINNRD